MDTLMALSTLALVIITGCYAVSTHRMLKEMRSQRESADEAITEARRAALLSSYLQLYTSRPGAKIPKELSGDQVQVRIKGLLDDLEIGIGSTPLGP